MAKRSKRSAAARRRQETVRASGPARTSVPARKTEAAETQAVDFRTEYQYVLADLKRFGILAVAMIALLVVLALVL